MIPAKTLKVRRWDRGARLLAALLLLLAAALLVSQSPALVRQAGAQTSGPSSLVVKDLKTGDPIANFNYTINADNVGDPADPANMPSVIKGQSNSPVAAVGDQGSAGSVDLDPGKYVASVSSDGYKLGGEHFSAGDTVTVLLEPEPKAGLDPSRLARIRVHAFEDNRMVNGENDAPLESGLEGFDVVIKDEVGHVTQDYYGNAIGTEYEKDANGDLVLDPNGQPIPVPNTGGNILTDANGDAVVENLAPGKYGVQVIAPDGSGWIQTSTLEGTHTIDAWIDEGNDGTISEVPGVSPSPMAEIGFVKEQPFANPGSGGIKGRARTALEYITESANAPLGDPVKSPYVALTALDLNDQLSYLGRGNPDGTFDIQNVPDGKYQLVIWDEPMDYIISFRTATVSGGNVVDMGDIGVPRWFGKTLGTVFEDNGKDGNGNPITRADGTDAAGNQILDCDQNDPNSCEKGLPGVDVGTRYKDGSAQYGALTDARGHYAMNETFPLGRFTVAEVGNVRYAPTGASVRSEYNGTDLKSLSVPGALLMSTFSWTGKNYIDWGKKRYTGSENGGISGIVYYATMRTEENARYQSGDPYEPGVPGVKVDLYQADTDANGDPIKEADGSVKTTTADPIATVNTDSWQQPTGCDVLDENGNPPTDPLYAPTAQKIADNCLEVPALGNETRDGVFDGGYAFSTYTDPSDGQTKPLPPGDYVVKMRIPKDKNGNDLYKIVKEEDVNIEKGENFVPQVPPPPCAGALHTVNDPRHGPYDGQQMPLCDSKLVHLNAQQNAGADFFMFTDTPIPGRVWGLVTDDLNVETDPSLLYYGDKKGVAHIPVGVYDHTGRLLQTVYTDDNGIFETILPSTGTFNVPTPSGVSPNMYTFLANDPGPDPANPNPVQGPGTVMGYDPNYSTLPLIYDVWPGKTTAADMAILPNTPGGDPGGAQAGEPEDGVPDVQDIENPVVGAAGARDLVINGQNFGASPQVLLDGKQITVNSVSGTQINATVPAGFPVGPHELLVKSNGKTSETGLTVHVLGKSTVAPGKKVCKKVPVKKGKKSHKKTVCHTLPGKPLPGYEPQVVRVGQGQSIQDAINSASGNTLIVVGPGTYNENLIMHKGVKLQGVGPGGVTIDGSYVSANSSAWNSLLGSVNFDGDRNVNEGSAITVLAKAGQFTPGFRPSIDGFTIKGGHGDSGGGVFVNGYGRYLDIANNVIQGNHGYYGGAVTLGRPYSGDAHNTNVRVRYNRVLGNGGQRFSGAVGIFGGAAGYEVSHNVICGNYSAEYGGGISHFGYSPNGKILHNKVCYNGAFDEGGGILVGGELAQDLGGLSQGSGPVDIYANKIQGNLSNDDGGGIRLIDVNRNHLSITNNMIVNNAATDHGGGIALDDAPDTTISNNTIAGNVTTATAEDSDGQPHGAGLVSETNSSVLQQRLPSGSPTFSNPVLFNNVFRDNRAGHWNGHRIVGLGLPGDATPKRLMDMEVVGAGNRHFSPVYSILSAPYGPASGTNKVGANPKFVSTTDTLVNAMDFTGDPSFIAVTLNPNIPAPGLLPGDYHLTSASGAKDAGAAASGTAKAPLTDIDGDRRPSGSRFDMGADEYVRPAQ